MASRMASAASKQVRRPAAPAGRNDLERLLIECVQSTRAVPSESGVCFHVHVPADAEASMCLIFHVDLERQPLVAAGPRPDYLVLYGTRDGVILTIVEMKGRGEQDLTHGVDQIGAFAQLLRRQLKEHVPGKLRVIVQGILLMAHGAHPPLHKLGEMSRKGLVIAPVAYHHGAELFPYVSRRLQLEGFAYRHTTVRAPRPFSRLEQLMTENKLPARIDDAFCRERYRPGCPGIYVNYAAPATTKRRMAAGYAALATDPGRADIGIGASGDELHALLVDELETQLGLSTNRRSLRLIRVPATSA